MLPKVITMLRSVLLLLLLVVCHGYHHSESDKIHFHEHDHDYVDHVYDHDDENKEHTYQERPKEQDTLILTHVIFRHGDRTPDVSTIYPNDPYINETYFPFGRGQLTLKGKERAYKLGKILRERYGNFLGDLYYPDILEATTSAYPRTQMTLQLVLAGLFPPRKESLVDYSLNWQPIPYSYSNFENDKLIATFRSCEKMFDIADDLEKTEVYRKEMKQFNRLYRYLSQYSGWDVNGTRLGFFIQNTLHTEEDYGYQLPEWADKVYPGPLGMVASNFWKLLSSTVELRRISIGNLLKKIVDDSIAKAQGTLRPIDRKIFLYSGHDFTVVPFLAALGNYDGSLTPYTANIMFELHEIEKQYGFKIYFEDYSMMEPKLLHIPMCGTFCPLQRFMELLQDHFPGDNWCPQ